MFILKEVKEFYSDLSAIENVTNYIIADKNNQGMILPWVGSYNIFNVINSAWEMYSIKAYYNDLNRNYIRHFIISFEQSDYFTFADAMLMAVKVCGYFCGDFQVVYAVHQNTRHLHIHFVLNTTSFVDGKRLRDSYESRARFYKYLRTCYNRVKCESNRIIRGFKNQEQSAWD